MNVGMNAPFGIPFIQSSRSRSGPGQNKMPFSPLAVGITLVVLIAFVALFATISGGSGEVGQKESASLVGLDIVLWGCLVFLVLVNGMAYLFNIDVTAQIKGLFTSDPEIEVEVSPPPGAAKTPTLLDSQQVFHVSDNKYTYKDAKAICSAYGGRLATIKELQAAYGEGADWCGYGWSDEQMALFPTQYEKWERLQGIKGHEHDCGRPGINGGYIANPNVRFGVNCYGRKPDPTESDYSRMRTAGMYPMTEKERRFNRRVRRWRGRLHGLEVSPFNASSWFS